MYILSIFSILQIWANYNKNLCEKGDIYNFNEIVTIGFCGIYSVNVWQNQDKCLRGNGRGCGGRSGLSGIATPGEWGIPGGEGNRRQIRWYSVAWIIRSSRIMTVFIYVLKVPRSSRIMTGTEQDGRIITEKECRLWLLLFIVIARLDRAIQSEAALIKLHSVDEVIGGR